MDDPLQPVRNKIAGIADLIGISPVAETGDTVSSTTSPKNNKAIFHKDFSTGLLQAQQVNTVIDPTYIYGAERPRIVLLQYCDFGSRYCLQGYEEAAL